MPETKLPPKPLKWLPFPPAAAGAAPAAPPPTRADRLLNRDLSWLSFNDRVLAEAADAGVPPLERLRFATIVSSNLDEFFSVRVAEIQRLARRYPLRRFPDGLTAHQALGQIREHVLRQKARQAVVVDEILAALDEKGIRVHADFGPIQTKVDEEIASRLPEIKYLLRKSTEPPPRLISDTIHVFVRFPGEYAILTIQERDQRLLALPSKDGVRRFALAERWLAARAERFFPGREVIEAFPFKLIREADLRYRPDDEETLEDQIAAAVAKRSRAKVVRLEVDAPSYYEGALFLAAGMGLDSAGLYRFDLPLDLRTLGRLYNLRGTKRLRYPPVEPQVPPPLVKRRKLYDVVRRFDMLLHHPYDSFDPVVEFLQTAAEDPAVERVFHTMYRTSRVSPVMDALKLAAAKGKKVTAYVEIRARFDELNNLRWAEDLRRAGVRVVRPFGGLKVHSKVSQVLRREGGEQVLYTHLGTGNYHPTTAKQYTDLSLLTSDPLLGAEVREYFDALSKRRRVGGLKHLLVAPTDLHGRVLRMIREETKIAKGGEFAHIVAKMNSLVDPDIIDALYAASQAGARVDLQVRGICCLKPGIKGLSENIRVVSVVDRFLEHSRVYYFRGNGVEKVYLSSADWMPRNFYSRYELAFPVKDPALRRFVRDVILDVGLADNQKGWVLKADGTYERAVAGPNAAPIRSQQFFSELAERDYEGTILQYRVPSTI